jgi:ribosomal-protein-alanine N-acetyltransferase
MSRREAVVVAAWRYEPPYSFYDWTADADDLAELLGEDTREGKYFSAFDADEELVGWFAFSCEGDCVALGLGLRPDLTGRGFGLAYLEAGLTFAQQRFRPSRFRLSVATFNERAIRVYERAGFTPLRTFEHATNGGIHRFLEMTRPA